MQLYITCLELTRMVRQWVKRENFFGPCSYVEECALWMLRDMLLLIALDAESCHSCISMSKKFSLLRN